MGNRWLYPVITIAQQEHFDLIAAHDWLAALAAKSLKTIYQIPLILTVHDTQVGIQANRLTRDQLYIAQTEEWIIRIADRIITTSNFMRNEISTIYKIPKELISVIPCGVNPDHFKTKCNLQDFRQLFASDNNKIILFVGRLSHIKGPNILLDAAQIILKTLPGTTFIFAGEGILAPELYKKASELKEEGQVIFTGHLSGKVLAATYRIADCLVVASIYEPFSMAVLEGMVCGTPVVVSDTGGLSEIVENEITGIKVPPQNPEKLAQEVIRLLSTPNLAQSLVKTAMEKCYQNFVWERIALQVSQIYDESMKKLL